MRRKSTPGEASVLTMTVDELASLIPCGRMQAYKAVKSGQFPSIRVGKTFKVLRGPALRLLQGDPNELFGSEQAGQQMSRPAKSSQ